LKKVIEMVSKILALMEHPKPMVLIADSLERLGHIMHKANNYQDAMSILRQHEVDLIIADVHLQNGGSIFDFLRWVKGDPHMRSVPFVCFSTEPVEVPRYLSDGVRTAARALGAAKYMTMEKFDRDVFVAEIDWLLPQDRVGNYYAVAQADGDGDCHPDGNGPHLDHGTKRNRQV
jgi:CheY-like chemotaxis protein